MYCSGWFFLKREIIGWFWGKNFCLLAKLCIHRACGDTLLTSKSWSIFFLELDPVLKYKWQLGEVFPSSSQGIEFICLRVGLLAGECVPTTLANNVKFGMKQLRYNPKAQTSFIGKKLEENVPVVIFLQNYITLLLCGTFKSS